MHMVFIKFPQHKCTTFIYTVIIKNKGYTPGLPWAGACQKLCQSRVAPELPPARGSPPRISQRSLCTTDRRRSRPPPTHSLYACNDDDAII
jgi:hypothetical protein